MKRQLAAIIERDGTAYVSLCPELDIASQGSTIEEGRDNLQEAVELFFETASETELQTRLHEDVYVTRVEVSVGCPPAATLVHDDLPVPTSRVAIA